MQRRSFLKKATVGAGVAAGVAGLGAPALAQNLPTLNWRLVSSFPKSGGWFVPIDAMVTHRVTKNFLFALSASKQVVQTYNQYDWSIYGKLSFNF